MSKKYNSVGALCFSIEHDEADGSDLTGMDYYLAIKKRIQNITDKEEF